MHAFHALKDLKELHIPRIDQTVSLDLCNILTGIDAITIGTFEVSCFELVSGHSFEDSTAIVVPSTEQSKAQSSESCSTFNPLKWNAHAMDFFSFILANSSSSAAITTSTAKGISPTTSEKIIETTTKLQQGSSDKPMDQATPPLSSSTVVTTNEAEMVATPEQTNRIQMSAKLINNILIGEILYTRPTLEMSSIIYVLLFLTCRYYCGGAAWTNSRCDLSTRLFWHQNENVPYTTTRRYRCCTTSWRSTIETSANPVNNHLPILCVLFVSKR